MPYTEHSLSELARLYFLYQRGREEYEWAFDELTRLYNEDLEQAWTVTLQLIEAAPSLKFLYQVAAGELEVLVREHGPLISHRIKNEIVTNPKFLYSMTGVWLTKDNPFFDDFNKLLKSEIRTKEDFEDLEIRCDVPDTVALIVREPTTSNSKALKKIEELHQDLKNEPGVLTPYLEIANICLHELPEHIEVAVSAIKNYLENEPNSVNGLFVYARILEKTGDSIKAEKIFKDVIEFDPWHKGAFVGLGNLLFNQKRFSEAIVFLRQAVDWYSVSPGLGEISARYFLAQASLECGEKEEAVKQLKIVSKFKSTYPWEEGMKHDATERLKSLDLQ